MAPLCQSAAQLHLKRMPCVVVDQNFHLIWIFAEFFPQASKIIFFFKIFFAGF
jgi:hypothetical protein